MLVEIRTEFSAGTGLKDQTGTEEVNDHSMLSAMENMMAWLRDRGELTPEDFVS